MFEFKYCKGLSLKDACITQGSVCPALCLVSSFSPIPDLCLVFLYPFTLFLTTTLLVLRISCSCRNPVISTQPWVHLVYTSPQQLPHPSYNNFPMSTFTPLMRKTFVFIVYFVEVPPRPPRSILFMKDRPTVLFTRNLGTTFTVMIPSNKLGWFDPVFLTGV